MTVEVELTRFRGHPQTWGGGHDAEEPTAVFAGVPAADGRPGEWGADARRHPTPPRAALTTPNATFGSQMARFARPYCATEPVRTVPFFNLYDDIQIT